MDNRISFLGHIRLRLQQWFGFLSAEQISLAIILLGIFVRLKHYFVNSSFWLEEAWQALDISTRTYSSIISARIFSYDLPTAPPGFLLIEKTFVILLGNNEYAFRLFPLLCGIASLFLFYELLKKFFDRWIIPAVLLFFVFADILIYNSVQLKQYSSGVFIVLLLYYLMLHMDSAQKISVYRSTGYGILGGITIAFFYPSVFILAGLGIILMGETIRNKDWPKFRALLFSVFLWVIAFIIIYGVYCHYMFENQIIQRKASPYPVVSLENLELVGRWFAEVFLAKTAGFISFWIAIYFMVLGIGSLGRENKKILFAFVLPILFVFTMVTLKKYPVQPRFFVAFLPGAFIIFAAGIKVAFGSKKKLFILLNTVCLLILMIGPIKAAGQSMVRSYGKEEIKPLMRYLKESQRPGDALFINNAAQYAYVYYLGYYRFSDPIDPFTKMVDHLDKDEIGQNMIMRKEYYDYDRSGYYKGVEKAGDLFTVYGKTPEPFGNNPRTWILLVHIPDRTRRFILATIARTGGIPLMSLERNDAFLYLFDLSGPR